MGMSTTFQCIFYAICMLNVLVQSQVDNVIQNKTRTLQYKRRCTRRFTPGVCLVAVTSMWSFEFQIMNCTERLGCPQSQRTNRFRSYEICMRRCQPLVDLYLQILSHGGDKINDTKFFLRNKPSIPIRRDGNGLDFKSPHFLAPEDQQYPGDEAIMASVMYGDKDGNLKEDVDFQTEVRETDDYFGFH